MTGTSDQLCLQWTGNIVKNESSSRRVSVEISGVEADSKKYRLKNVRTVNDLALPAQTVNIENLQTQYKHLKNIDVSNYENAVPQLMIGNKDSKIGVPQDVRESDWDSPIAIKTRLGWVVYGSTSDRCDKSEKYHQFHVCECSRESEEKTTTSNGSTNIQNRRFWSENT